MKAVCVAVHDVAPATWPQCQALFAMLDGLGCRDVTLLVVPQYHHGERVVDSPTLVRAIDRRIANGAEVALHGYYHIDDSPPARRLREWLRRRLLTQGEGEFESLSEAQATERITRGMDEFASVGWDVHGFVAPAWLAGSGTMRALMRFPVRYTTSLTGFTLLREGRTIWAPCFTASTRAGWRRTATRAATLALYAATRETPLVRVALHPSDTRYPDIIDSWRELLRRLLVHRQALTKFDAVTRCSDVQPEYRPSEATMNE